jgi:hypothetical protein
MEESGGYDTVGDKYFMPYKGQLIPTNLTIIFAIR